MRLGFTSAMVMPTYGRSTRPCLTAQQPAAADAAAAAAKSTAHQLTVKCCLPADLSRELHCLLH
jgi:hypothetical protein